MTGDEKREWLEKLARQEKRCANRLEKIRRKRKVEEERKRLQQQIVEEARERKRQDELQVEEEPDRWYYRPGGHERVEKLRTDWEEEPYEFGWVPTEVRAELEYLLTATDSVLASSARRWDGWYRGFGENPPKRRLMRLTRRAGRL